MAKILVRLVISRLAIVFDFDSLDSIYFPEIPYEVLKNEDAISINKDVTKLLDFNSTESDRRLTIQINFELQIAGTNSKTREFLEIERHFSSLPPLNHKSLKPVVLLSKVGFFPPEIEFETLAPYIPVEDILVLKGLMESDSQESTTTKTESIAENDKAWRPSSLCKDLDDRQHIFRELLNTEKKYLDDLSCIINGYMKEMSSPTNIPVPEALKNKSRFVFQNIPLIYEWQQAFFEHLKKCVINPVEFGPTFERCERKFQVYATYCQHKYRSELLVSENIKYFMDIRDKLEQHHEIDDLLITPFQRLTKYENFFDRILVHTKNAKLEDEAESLQQTCVIIKRIVKLTDYMQDLGRIRLYDGRIQIQGILIKKGTLSVVSGTSVPSWKSTLNSKMREHQVFLFEKSLMFTEFENKKTKHSSFLFKHIIPMNKLSLEVYENRGKKLLIKLTDPKQPKLFYACDAMDDKEHDMWFAEINNLLKAQNALKQALERPQEYSLQKNK